MTSDKGVVERLRDFAEHLEPAAEYTDEQATLREAAMRIETLERALRRRGSSST